MQTPHLIKVKQQDTPIKSLLFHWREDDTDFTVEVPYAWALKVFGIDTVTDTVMRSESIRAFLLVDIQEKPAEWIASVRLEWSDYIAFLTCSDAPTPEIFAA